MLKYSRLAKELDYELTQADGLNEKLKVDSTKLFFQLHEYNIAEKGRLEDQARHRANTLRVNPKLF